MFLSLIAVSDLVVRVALGAKWMEAAPIISIIAGTAYLTTIGQYNQAIILVKDKPHWQTVLTSIYAVSNISLFLVVVRYGLQALAIGFTVRAVLLYPLSVGAALHLLRIKPMAYAARIAPSLAASAVMVGALLLLHRTIDVPSPLLALVIHVAVGAVVYAAALFVIGRRDMLALIRFARTAVARG
jgi:O-antigen/teichoic acid export membrane protein